MFAKGKFLESFILIKSMDATVRGVANANFHTIVFADEVVFFCCEELHDWTGP